MMMRGNFKTAALCAISMIFSAAACVPADAGVMASLFPYGFASEEAAIHGCGDLVNAAGIAQAGRGALVYAVMHGKRTLISHNVVPSFAKNIDDPKEASLPIHMEIETRAAKRFSVLAARSGGGDLGGVRCWFLPAEGLYRLVSIEVIIP